MNNITAQALIELIKHFRSKKNIHTFYVCCEKTKSIKEEGLICRSGTGMYVIKYHPNGLWRKTIGYIWESEVKESLRSRHGYLRHGPYTEWSEDGVLRVCRYFEKGVENGVAKKWSSNGTLKHTIAYRNGQKHGTEQKRSKCGDVVLTRKWYNDYAYYIVNRMIPNKIIIAQGPPNDPTTYTLSKYTYDGRKISETVTENGKEVSHIQFLEDVTITQDQEQEENQ